MPKREGDRCLDWAGSGLSSPVTVVGDRGEVVSHRGEVPGLDAHSLANGNGGPLRDGHTPSAPRGENAPARPRPAPGPPDADNLWCFDLTPEAGIGSHAAAHRSILIRGNHLGLNTGTGVHNLRRKIRTPDAARLAVLVPPHGPLPRPRRRRSVTP